MSCPVTRAGSFTLASQHQQERNYQFQKEPLCRQYVGRTIINAERYFCIVECLRKVTKLTLSFHIPCPAQNLHIPLKERFMKKLVLATLLCSLSLSAFAADYSVKPKVTELSTPPTRVLLVGNSFMYYNCGVNGYISGLSKSLGIKMSAWRLSEEQD